jgi:uncharacterized membrane protein
VKVPTIGSFSITVTKGGSTTTKFTVYNPNHFTITVTSFTITDYGGFKGKIEAINLPLEIGSGQTKEVELSIRDEGSDPGTYTIKFKISGTP